jgi:hypothetical protein
MDLTLTIQSGESDNLTDTAAIPSRDQNEVRSDMTFCNVGQRAKKTKRRTVIHQEPCIHLIA